MLPFVTCIHIALRSSFGLHDFSLGIDKSPLTEPMKLLGGIAHLFTEHGRGLEKKVDYV